MTPPHRPVPFVVHAEPDETLAVLADRARTDGALGVVDCRWARGAEPPPHTIARADRLLLVTDGACRVRLDQQEHDVGRGGLAFVPRGVRLSLEVTTDTCRVTMVVVPAGAEAWFAAALPGLPADVALRLATDHGVTLHPR